MSKPLYEPPILIRHQAGMMNKFGRAHSMRPLDRIDGVTVDELVKTYGSPLFVYSARTLVDMHRELRQAFSVRYPRVRIAWSYKTNYLDAVCKIFHKEGAWAEVVSEFEWEKAVRNGIPGDRIHFNGPYKTKACLDRVLREGTMIHIDHFDELAAAEEVAKDMGEKVGVALRLNLQTDMVPAWSRFGFNIESGQAKDAVGRLLGGGALELSGIHCHLGTYIVEPEAYKQGAERLAEFANEIRDEYGVKLSFIDIGGGFASRNTLKAQYLPGDQATPSFSRYAEAVTDGLQTLEYSPQEMPTLVLETGRALVDEAGYLVSTVVANKRLPDGSRALVLDAGVNVLFTSFWYSHDVIPAQDFGGTPEPTKMYGPLCMNIDVVREPLLFPRMKVGERVVFKNVGAYNVTQWMQFITYRPGVVLVGPNGKHGLMRRPEDLESVVGHEEVPEWL